MIKDFKPEWLKCPCGHSSCKREFIANLGIFYVGSGFDLEEKELINAAFKALAEKNQKLTSNKTLAEIIDTKGYWK